MKKLFTYLLMLAALVVGITGFVACGGGDGGGSSTSAGGDDSTRTGGQEEGNEALYGTWFGISGSSIISKLVFAPGNNGYIKMNSTTQPYAHNGLFTYQFDRQTGTIAMNFKDTGSSAAYRIQSLESEKMTLINDYDMTYSMTLSSYSTEIPTEYDNNPTSNVEKTNGVYITMPKTNSRYTTRTIFHYYKKTLDNGAIDLYKDQACQKLVGRASTNTYDTWGDYSVGSYQYIVKTTTDNAWVYYFFD